MPRGIQHVESHRGGYIRDVPDGTPQGWEEEEVPLTKTGKPDRRFLGARHLPPIEDENPDYRHARQGGEVNGMHVTLEGKPDRRFKENRGLSDEEVLRRWAQSLSSRYSTH